MIFFDTCVWIELLLTGTPRNESEIAKAQAATAILQNELAQNEKIITCKEQILEIISAIEKVTMRTVNRTRKDNGLPGIGQLKDFRKLDEFSNTKRLCKIAMSDL